MFHWLPDVVKKSENLPYRVQRLNVTVLHICPSQGIQQLFPPHTKYVPAISVLNLEEPRLDQAN